VEKKNRSLPLGAERPATIIHNGEKKGGKEGPTSGKEKRGKKKDYEAAQEERKKTSVPSGRKKRKRNGPRDLRQGGEKMPFPAIEGKKTLPHFTRKEENTATRPSSIIKGLATNLQKKKRGAKASSDGKGRKEGPPLRKERAEMEERKRKRRRSLREGKEKKKRGASLFKGKKEKAAR